MSDVREGLAEHYRVALHLLGEMEMAPLPADVSDVAVSFAESICEHHPLLADDLARAVRNTDYDPVELAEALIRGLDIPEDSPAGETLGRAFTYWGVGAVHVDPRMREGHCVTAAQLAAEAICVWARWRDAEKVREPKHFQYSGKVLLGHPRCTNAPANALKSAKCYLDSRKETQHA